MGIYPIFRHTHMGDNRNPGECHVKLTTSTPQASPAPRPVAAWRATRGRRCPWPVPSYMRRRWGSIPGSDRVTGIAVPISCTSHRACWICDNQLLGILICINTIRICHLQEILFWGDVKKSKKKWDMSRVRLLFIGPFFGRSLILSMKYGPGFSAMDLRDVLCRKAFGYSILPQNVQLVFP